MNNQQQFMCYLVTVEITSGGCMSFLVCALLHFIRVILGV